MKKLLYLIVLALILGLVLSGCLLSNVGQVSTTSQTKVKPEGLGGAQTYAWNLSGAVMPVPPYGLADITGSDTASKLIVNQPNGAVEVTITGVMNGLTPERTYTVFLAREYIPFIRWDLKDTWGLQFYLNGAASNAHDIIISDQLPDGTFSGVGRFPAGGPYISTYNQTITGIVTSGVVTFHSTYPNLGYEYWYTVTGEISKRGTMMSGTWIDIRDNTGTFSSLYGAATSINGGSTWYTGLFTNTIQPFTFVTDADGSGSWHVNLRDSDFPGPGTYTLSVWINNGTILISDNFEVVVD